MSNLLKYARTLYYLRPVQIYGRVWRALYSPAPNLRSAPPVRHITGRWCARAMRVPSMVAPDSFCFLNRQGRVNSAADWNAAEHDKLWLYNLHYFDDLNAAGRVDRLDWHTALIARWIAENPPRSGNGWEPYPLSLRIVNWIKWGLAGN